MSNENMNPEKLNLELYQKMSAEQDSFRAWLTEQPAVEVLNHAYEYALRQDILSVLEDGNLTAAHARALLESPCPLADIYQDWSKQDTFYYMDDIRDTILKRADALLDKEQIKAKSAAKDERTSVLAELKKAVPQKAATDKSKHHQEAR